ncbi:MAG: TonB-dependent receptor [Sediminibacterium sp.]|nr:TonB-dependent receptor [Sediminibacterium sp.]
MSKKIINFLLFLLVVNGVFSQAQIIQGTIKDKNGNPISGATVEVRKSQKSQKIISTTDNQGAFQINTSIGSELYISSGGYISTKLTINTNQLNIILQDAIDNLAEVITLGTRRTNRVKLESVVPVDVVKYNQIGITTARVDLVSNLNYAIPSFNSNRQSGTDGADFIDVGTLRGLGPDQTLVLMNDKRYHPTALVALFGTRGRANSGVDMNSFPAIAVDKIEVLRDGATAQYGTDAIAGVINVGLRENTDKWNIVVDFSAYWDNKYNSSLHNQNNDYYAAGPIDGQTLYLGINKGWKWGKRGGFINVSFEALNQDKTFRAPDPKDNVFGVTVFRRAFGDGSYSKLSGFYNLEIPLSDKKPDIKLYSFGGYNQKNASSYAWSRNYDNTDGSGSARYPVYSDGTIIPSPIYRRTNDGLTTYYNPLIETIITDINDVIGLKGVTKSDWKWDISTNLGYNDFHYFGNQTFNASLIGNATRNKFDDGGFNFTQWINDIDFTKSFGKAGEAGSLNVAFGGEVRLERYQIYAGEVLSYSIIPSDLPSGNQQVGGSQGFPGFSPQDATVANRTNVGVYGDVEWTPLKPWTLEVTLRAENYSDFGSVFVGKFATLVKVSKFVNIRGSFSNGFRAPTLAQINFRNTLTSIINKQLVQSRLVDNNDPIARAAGIPKLKQETSLNFSLGFTWKPLNNLNITVDGYYIQIKDRVILTGIYSVDDNLPQQLIDKIKAQNVSTVYFFTNGLNTTNYGVDITADYSVRFDKKNSLKVLLAANFQNVNIDQVNIPAELQNDEQLKKVYFSPREEYFIKASAPNAKATLSVDWTHGKFGLGTRATYFGLVQLAGYGDFPYNGTNLNIPSDADPNVTVLDVYNYNPRVVFDIYARYQIANFVNLNIGVDNILNTHPDYSYVPAAKNWSPNSGNNETGGPWDGVQMGYNGFRFFAKLVFNF